MPDAYASTPVTLAEHYSRATHSTDLRVREHRGDVDLLIAAGWLDDSLGALLYRLRVEFDGAKALLHDGDAALSAIDRWEVLSRLSSLRAAREALGVFACAAATRQRFMQPDAVVNKLAGRVLDVFLDPNCPHCRGVGSTGGYGVPQLLCTHCRGGKRSLRIGRTHEERGFTAYLLASMEQRVSHVDDQMRRYMRH